MEHQEKALQQTILVTGGAGFIGSNFVLQSVGSGDRVINLDKLTYAGNLENLQQIRSHPDHVFVRGGIEDNDVVGQLLAKFRPTAVVNFAAESHVDRSIHGPEEFVLTNLLGTFRILDTCLKHWRTLKGQARDSFRFLQVSTDEVYGSLSADEPGFREQTPYSPNSPYSASKAGADHLVRAYFHTYVAGHHHELLQQLRSLSVSRKIDPLNDFECSGRAISSSVWGWPERSRLVVC